MHQPPWTGVLGSIPKREELGKTGAPCVQVPGSSRVPAPPWLGSRSPDGWDQIPRWAGGWVLHQPPWSFGFDSQTRGTRENRAPPCVKVPGSSPVPGAGSSTVPSTASSKGYCTNKHKNLEGLPQLPQPQDAAREQDSCAKRSKRARRVSVVNKRKTPQTVRSGPRRGCVLKRAGLRSQKVGAAQQKKK